MPLGGKTKPRWEAWEKDGEKPERARAIFFFFTAFAISYSMHAAATLDFHLCVRVCAARMCCRDTHMHAAASSSTGNRACVRNYTRSFECSLVTRNLCTKLALAAWYIIRDGTYVRVCAHPRAFDIRVPVLSEITDLRFPRIRAVRVCWREHTHKHSRVFSAFTRTYFHRHACIAGVFAYISFSRARVRVFFCSFFAFKL